MSQLQLLLLLSVALLQLTHTAHGQETAWAVSMEKSVKGFDIQCGRSTPEGKPAPYCYMCGGISAVAAACDANPKCAGFDMENWNCGYLKSQSDAKSLQSQVNFMSFCKFQRGARSVSCAADYFMYPGYDRGAEGDWDCGAKDEGTPLSYCRSKGSVLTLMNACDKWGAKCDGFAVEQTNNEFGFLKQDPKLLSSMRKREGWLYFVKAK